MVTPFTRVHVPGWHVREGVEKGGGGKGTAQLTAAALTGSGRLFVAEALTPYDVENLYDHIRTHGGSEHDDVSVEIDLGGTSPDTPELRALERRVERLRNQGLSVHLHTSRLHRKRFARSAQG